MRNVKKHVKKFVKHRRYASWRKRTKLQMPLLFASLFAVIMVAYGISLIFAATVPTQFSLTSATQTVTPGQTKTVTVHFDPKGNNVRGGSVKVTFDPNRLTFNKATAASNIYPYYLTSGTAGTGSYTFTFSSYSTTKQVVDFGALEFTVKPTTGTVTTNLAYTTASTYAYYPSSSSRLASSYSGAAMVIQGTPVTAKVALNPASVAYNGSTTVSWTSTNATACTNNFGGTTGTTGSKVISGLTAARSFTVTCTKDGVSGSDTKSVAVAAKPSDPNPPGGGGGSGSGGNGSGSGGSSGGTSGSDSSGLSPNPPLDSGPQSDFSNSGNGDQTADDLEESIVSEAPVKKQSPVKAVAALAGGLLLLGGCAYVYFVRLKPRSHLPKATNLNSGLFDDGKGVAAVAAGGSLASKEKQLEEAAATAGQLSEDNPDDTELTISHDEAGMSEQPEEDLPMENEQEQPTQEPTPEEQPEPQDQPEATDDPALEADQADEVYQVEEAVSDQAPQAPEEPQLSPADQVAQAALANIAAHKGPTLQESLAREQAANMPKPPEPQWQKSVTKKKAPIDEPKDMFELAEEDPDNFGSAQLAETYGEETVKHHDAQAKK